MPFLSSFSNTGKAKATFPGQAGTPTISSQASGQVGLSWTAPAFSGGAPITDYKIEYSSNGGSSWTEWSHTPSNSVSATVTGLADYQTYIFRVSAKNAVGLGNASSNSASAAQINAMSGGSESTVSNYNGTGQTWKIHQFTGSGTLSVTRSIYNSNILVVGAGGSGGGVVDDRGGGGGGGGAVTASTTTLTTGSKSVVVGSPSSISGITANGGGGGGVGYGGNYGGSSGNGNPGGGGSPDGWHGGGGGGAGGAGSSGYSGEMGGGGGAGGPGTSSNISGSSVTYGSGGRGGDIGGGGANGSAGIVIVAYRIA